MTLARTALRLCVGAALKGVVGSRPTIADGRVYDSRIDDIQPETFVEDARPVIIVLSDQDEGEQLSANNGGPPFRRWMDIVIEMAMVSRVKDGADYVIGFPDTDPRLEATLDYLEFQVMRRLGYDPAPMPVLFRKMARIRKSECHRQVEDGTGVKIACRVLTLECDVGDDQPITYNVTGVLPTGYDLLPEPLRTVAQALPAGSSGRDICDAIVAAMTPLTVPPLLGVDLEVDANGNPAAVPPIKASAETSQP